jgi:hypothetical protein
MAGKTEAQEALFAAITKATAQVARDYPNSSGNQATALESLALAYRYAAGGAQPGSAQVES